MTGKCCWEFMEESTPVLEVGRKLRRLDKEELKAIEVIVDHLIEEHHISGALLYFMKYLETLCGIASSSLIKHLATS